MGTLRILLFGNMQIGHDDDMASAVKVPHSVQVVLSYLLLQRPRGCPRDVLAALAWGDLPEDQARGCLSTALWRLRTALEPSGIAKGTYLVTGPAREVSFNWESDHWLDLETFEERSAAFLALRPGEAHPDAVAEVEEILPLYRGELLAGFYEDWALRERERLRSRYLKCLARLMHYYKQRGAYEESLHYGERILHYDPLHEEVHREVMRLYLDNGQRALAVRQYEACREALASELGVTPMAETEALYAEATAGARRVPSAAPEAATLEVALRELRAAMRQFEQTSNRVQQAVRQVERVAEQAGRPELAAQLATPGPRRKLRPSTRGLRHGADM